ncbi:MAG: hypothetical protein ACK528_09105 [Alphaproteobacteria bacterium]
MLALDKGHSAQALGTHKLGGVTGAGHGEEVRVARIVACAGQQRGNAQRQEEGGQHIGGGV